jgi:hypothetical protein
MASSISHPRDFEHPSRMYHRVRDVRNYEFEETIYGIKSITSLMNFRPVTLRLWNAYRQISLAKSLGNVGLVMRMRRGSLVMASSFHLPILSILYSGVTKDWKQ